ncbi:MAG: multicopper oxidase domain-containing protein [Chloroflexi bacterium]|nr:multicopper oxidase domain-containing protein [Chloroflexota bacterium]
MVKAISRRDFIKYAGGGVAALVVGSKLSWALSNPAFAATQTLNLRIGDTIKEMITHLPSSLDVPGQLTNPALINNDARCYFWVYKSVTPDLPHNCPGPIIVVAKGDTVNITVTNDLDEPHAFFIPGMVDSGPIPPVQNAPNNVWTSSFVASMSGAHLYYDNLNSPVNRMMGLHGAFLVMPTTPAASHRFTPYDNPTPGVQKLYDDFGTYNPATGLGSTHFPGLAWEQGDSTPWALDATRVNCPPFRQYVWLTHQSSPKLFAEVGNLPAGQVYSATEFLEKFLRGTFAVNNSSVVTQANQSYTPQYFTINGQSGMLSHFSPNITMMGRVGEPAVVHIINAGLWIHSMHLHANHFYVTCVDGIVRENPVWLDVFEVRPMQRIDYTVPFQRPPDVPNARGIGMPDTPLTSLANPGIPGSAPHPVWPCTEEFGFFLPSTNPRPAFALDGVTPVNLAQRMSPLCYPMHDHSEPSQTSQGGNYNMGLISGIYFTGDRNGTMDFPMDEDFHMAFRNIRGASITGLAAPPLGK